MHKVLLVDNLGILAYADYLLDQGKEKESQFFLHSIEQERGFSNGNGYGYGNGYGNRYGDGDGDGYGDGNGYGYGDGDGDGDGNRYG